MGTWRPPFDPADMQRPRGELDLIPSEVNKLGRAKAVAIRHQHHRRVAMAPTVLPGGVHEALDLGLRKVLAGSQRGIWQARGRDCSIFDAWSYEFQVRFRHGVWPSQSERLFGQCVFFKQLAKQN